MSRLFLSFSLGLLLTGAASCSNSLDEAVDGTCVTNFSATLIEQLQQKPKQTPAAEVIQYTYQGRTVYLVTGGDAANYSYLFDTCGNVICAAAGGPNKTGDGRCPDFAATATNATLLWRDPR
ncbi:DUF6970 domain-containing protein [Hymenobacter sublimis]|uniref:DUF6970 domain-containing protein n=1 Tax=Hymenobacter sublimis TaxID=2933777 RepID=A0ABY4J6T9_9BACT|nr:hypothetical protein [Hymenobacter sublimis]UPL48550.1 hypothetical protein MWH26_15320 [Hymenobacter sublimis]